MPGFQKQVNNQPAPGVEGSFASANPRATYVTGPGGLISGAAVVVGRFGWATPKADGTEGEVVNSNAALVAAGASRVPSGFVGNEQQAMSLTFLAEFGMTMLAGQAMEMFTRGDFWMKFGSAVARDQKVFANLLDGSAVAAATGTVPAPNSFTASFATNQMTVTAAPALPLKIGQSITGATIPANTFITAFGTGTGGTGTYTLSTSPGTIAAQATVGSDYVETKFRCLSVALINEIAKIGFGD